MRPYHFPMPMPPVALSIAGSDCCAGAGIQADLKTFSLLGVHGVTAVSTVIAETPREVHGRYHLSPAALQDQIQALLDCYPVAAIKTGLLGTASNITAVAELLENNKKPLIVDPVLSSSTGTAFASEEVLNAYREQLLPLASLVTPNLPEAEQLLGRQTRTETPDEHPALEATRELGEQLDTALLVTGGHSIWEEQATDILYDHGKLHFYSAPWIKLHSAHGTGCAYSAAITGFLAHGLDLQKAITSARPMVTRMLETSYAWPSAITNEELRALNQLPDHSAARQSK